MKLKNIFFYQAVKIGSQMINSAHSEHYDLAFEGNLAFIYCPKQKVSIAVPTTNIPQMTPLSYAPDSHEPKVMTNIEKARAAAAAKREAAKT